MLIAQISDPHIRPRGRLYQGVVDSNAQLAAAVRQLNALSPAPDLVLLSGDVVDEGRAEEYAMAREILGGLQAPLVALPGNHDDRDAFRAAFAADGFLPAEGPLHLVVEDKGPVRVVGLDVTVPGAHHGMVDDAAASWLEATLAASPHRPTLVMMHHPPIESGIPYIDIYRCLGADRLAAVIARHPQVERITCGHIHRHMKMRFAGTLLVTAPSTATAIALRPEPGAEPASFLEPPALLLHHWRPGTGLITHLLPVGIFPGPWPFA
ncbi:MAG: phosphodiesterase [Tistrella sp.]|mgnify:FL=1|uniref:Phosphodiesterase n=1 Tax=Tistrella mobilis TaxID=171437 RepID=A0A3B9IRG2_9PROT|nr:phosphodiesterase [Tistrella sp.]MAD35928.1 phosphodiesterase [Tistrella sp.]MBA74498.1 phosphodiesterase [Tistrella sp.]HAE50452.1 phosphodiesterase [Tistrella mobilis]|tara:strand:- start:215 stop:1012 length:798 start_codon:yes stop_codon:yes gene_type:complete